MIACTENTLGELLADQMQAGRHVQIVGHSGYYSNLTELTRERVWARDESQVMSWQGEVASWTGSWAGVLYEVVDPTQKAPLADSGHMDLVLIIDDAAPPWGVYPYGCPVLRVRIDEAAA